MWFGITLIMIAIPLLELALLIKLGQSIGVLATLALLIVTAAVGLMIMNAQGLAAFNRAAESMRDGRPPVEPATDSFMLMIAGGLLLMPGLISDVFGLALLVPPIRRAVAAWGLARLNATGSVRMTTWSTGPADRPDRRAEPSSPSKRSREPNDSVIEGDFVRIDEQPARGKEPKPPKDPA